MYTKEYFINKFESIPESAWRRGGVTEKDEAKCALGHVGVVLNHSTSPVYLLTDEARALIRLFSGCLPGDEDKHCGKVWIVNDSSSYGSPKDNILNKLKSL